MDYLTGLPVLSFSFILFENSATYNKIEHENHTKAPFQNAIVPYCSEKWNGEGLRLDGNTSNRAVPFQKVERLKE